MTSGDENDRSGNRLKGNQMLSSHGFIRTTCLDSGFFSERENSVNNVIGDTLSIRLQNTIKL